MSFFTSFIPSKTTCVEGKIILHLLDITLNIFFVPSTPTSIIFSSLRFDDSLFVLGTSVIPAKWWTTSASLN